MQRNYMFGNDKRYLNIAINEAVIKIAQVKVSGIVEKIACARTQDVNTPEDVSKSLRSLLKGFNRRAPVVCVIPASAVTSKNIEVPSSDPQEIKSIIHLQASRHTPYSREEVLIGHINLGVAADGCTRILLVIVHRNVVKERLSILESCSLTPEKILFAPEGIGRLYAKGLNLKKDSPPVAVIDFNVSHINFLILAGGHLVFSRSIPLGIKNLIEETDGATKVVEEINKTVAAYQGEEIDAALASYVLTTDSEPVKNILPLLQEGLKGDVRISPYVNFIKASAVKARLTKDFADDSFLDVIAPVISLSRTEVNLMPDEIAMKHTVERQSKEATKAGIFVVIAMVLLGAMFMSKLYFKDTFLNKNLREKFAQQREEVKALQVRMEKTKVIREYLEGRMGSLNALEEIYRITPKEMYLNGVSLDEGGVLTLTGVSNSMSQVFAYVKALEDSAMFMNAKTKSTSTKKEEGKDVAIFEVTLKLDEGRVLSTAERRKE